MSHVDFPGWDISVTLDRQRRMTGFTVRAALLAPGWAQSPRAPAPHPLTARLLRKVPTAELERCAFATDLDEAQYELAQAEGMLSIVEDGAVTHRIPLREDAGPGSALAEQARQRLEALAHEGVRRPGRRGRPEVEYAQLAAAYVANLHHPAPVARVARDANLSVSQVRALLVAARRHKLLTPSPPGRAGGELTPKALQLLEEPNGQHRPAT